MTDAYFKHSRESLQRLRVSLQEADEDTRYAAGFWVTGIAIMGLSIILQFGWLGLMFCFGLVVWRAGVQGLSS